jgi:PTS system nitrogen regulatory IIA component
METQDGPDMIDIADILSPEGVIVDLKACNSKRQVLKELAERAASLIEADSQQLLEALMERERLGTTGVGHGIAIPHARLDKLDRVVGLFARLDQPIDFEALDDQPSDLIFMLLAPNSADADSLKALARVSRVLRDRGLQQRLRQTHDAESVYRMLTEKPESHAA